MDPILEEILVLDINYILKSSKFIKKLVNYFKSLEPKIIVKK